MFFISIFILIFSLNIKIFAGICSSKNMHTLKIKNQKKQIILLAHSIEKVLNESEFYKIEKTESEELIKKIFCPLIKELDTYQELFSNNCNQARKIIHYQINMRKFGHVRNLKFTLNKIIEQESHKKIYL